MRRWAIILIIGLTVSGFLGCGPAAPPTEETTPDDAIPVTVRQLIERSEEYSEQPVSLTGKITVECIEGCWFFLNDGTGLIYVNLRPAGLIIPQKIGALVRVRGTIKGSGGNLQLLGETVQFLD